jgi:twitching motility two-component system response regulator PilH
MKQRIVIMDKDIKSQILVENFITEFEIIIMSDYVKGVELCKTAAPDLVIIGFLPKHDADGLIAVRTLKKDITTKKVPIIGFYHNLDRIQIEKDHQEGIETYLIKPINQDIMVAKIKECVNNAKVQKQYDSFVSKNHIRIENTTSTQVKISFQSGLKYVLPQIKNFFNVELLSSISKKDCCIDIRDFPTVSKDDALVLEKIVSVFGKKRIAVIAGKHMGAIISQSNLENRADLFMNINDYNEFLKKPKTVHNIEAI